MTAERVERLKARLNEVIATAEACDELSWPYTLPHPAPRRDAYAKAMPPSLAVSSPVPIWQLGEHVADFTAQPRCWGDHAGATPFSPCAVVARIVNKWLGETK